MAVVDRRSTRWRYRRSLPGNIIGAYIVALVCAAFVGPHARVLDVAGVNLFVFRVLLLASPFTFVMVKGSTIDGMSAKVIAWAWLWVLYAALLGLIYGYGMAAVNNLVYVAAGTYVIAIMLVLDHNTAGVRGSIEKAMAIIFAISIGLGTYEYVTTFHLPSSHVENLPYYASGRFASGFYGNPNNYSYVVVVLTPVAYRVFRTYGIIGKVIWSGLCLVAACLVYVNDSRLAFVSMAVMASVVVYKSKSRTAKILIVVPAVMVAYVAVEESVNIISELGIAGSSTNVRRDLVVLGWNKYVAKSYLFGLGPGGFAQNVGIERVGMSDLTAPHNLVIEMVYQYGPLGLLVVAFLARRAKMLWDRAPLLLGMVALAFTLMAFQNSTYIESSYTWVIAGYIILESRMRCERNGE